MRVSVPQRNSRLGFLDVVSVGVLQQHREVAAVLITYLMFLSAILVLAWTIA
jgi:hypothetical protein